MLALLRILVSILLIELVNYARARAPLGDWLPDVAVAITAAIALAGKPSIVLPATLVLAALRAPTTLADPFAGAGALFIFAWLVRDTRRFMTRERPPVVFGIAAVGVMMISSFTAAADAARNNHSASMIACLGSAVTTGMFAMLLVPSMRAFPLTRGLFDRRFGE